MNELEVIAAAVAIADPEERMEFLENQCRLHPELRRRLAPLLAEANSATQRPSTVRPQSSRMVLGAILALAAVAGGSLGVVAVVLKSRWKLHADHDQHVVELSELSEEATLLRESRELTLDTLRAATGPHLEKLLVERAEFGPAERDFVSTLGQRWQLSAMLAASVPEAHAIRVEGRLRLAYLWQRLGRREEARGELEEVAKLWASVVEQDPQDAKARHELARCLLNLGVQLMELGSLENAETKLREGVQGLTELQQENSESLEYRRDLAQGQVKLAQLRARQGKWDEALELAQKGLAAREKLVADFPADAALKTHLGASRNVYGELLLDQKRFADAETQFHEVLTILEPLAERRALGPEELREVAVARRGSAAALAGQMKLDEADEKIQAALQVIEPLSTRLPGVASFRVELARAYYEMGRLRQARGEAKECQEWFEKAIDTLKWMLSIDSSHASTRHALSDYHRAWARAQRSAGHPAAAIKNLEFAVQLCAEADRPLVRAERAMARAKTDALPDAIEEIGEIRGARTWSGDQLAQFASVYAEAAGKFAERRDEWGAEAVGLLREAVKHGFRDVERLKTSEDFASLRGRDDFAKLMAELAPQ